jgi:hypothetical protein
MTRRPRLVEASCVGGASLASSIGFTWPLVLHLQSRVHDVYDAVFQAWTIDWVQFAVEHGHNPYNTNMFAPEHQTLAYSDTLIGIAIPTLPLRWLGINPIGVLNISLILGFAASAAAAYLFVRLVTGSRVAAAVGGAGYAFGPFGAIAAAHLHVAFRPGVPLAAAAAWWLADRARAQRHVVAPAVALAVVIVWQGTVSFYPATYAAIAAIVVLAVRWRSLGQRGLVASAASLAATAGCAFLLAIPNLAVAARHPNSYRFDLAQFANWQGDFTKVALGLWFWGPILPHVHSGAPAALFPGVVLLLLGVVGAVYGWRARAQLRTITITGLALVGVGAVIAIGTGDKGWHQYAPYRLLFEIGPPFSALRGTARGWIIGLCGLGLLAGIGALACVTGISRRVHRSPHLVGAVFVSILVALIVFEGYDGAWFKPPSVRPAAVDAELARLPEPGGVVYLPMNTSHRLDLQLFRQPANLLGTTLHHRDTPNGYSGYFPPSYSANSQALWKMPAPSALALLRRLGVRFVVVHPSVEATPWAGLRNPSEAAPLRYLGDFGGDKLYEVPAA